MAVMDLAAAQGQATFMARAVAQIPAFRGTQVVIISNSLVKEDSNSSSRATKAIQSRTENFIDFVIWASSSAGQSCRLITDWSRVRTLPGPPIFCPPLWRGIFLIKRPGRVRKPGDGQGRRKKQSCGLFFRAWVARLLPGPPFLPPP